MSTITLRSVKGSGLTNNEIDANFTNLNTDKIEATQTVTLTNKTLALGSNTVSGTLAQFNTALSDGDFATLAGTETLTNKTLTSPAINGGTIDGTVIGGTTPAAGSFTTLSASGTTHGPRFYGNTTGITEYMDSLGTTGVYSSGATASIPNSVALYAAGARITTVTSTGLSVTGALSATGNVSTSAGTVTGLTTTATNGTISVSSTNDTTNGVVGTFSNHPLAFYVNSSKQATLDTSGNLGLGVTPSAWSHTGAAFDLPGNASIFAGATYATAGLLMGSNVYYNAGYKYKVSSQLASRYEQVAGVHSWFTAPSGTAGNAITFTQAMTLDASGNLLIRQTSTGLVNINGAMIGASDGTNVFNHSGTPSGRIYHAFGYDGTTIGSITQDGTTAVMYNTTSDARLKENITDANDAASLIDALQVRQFDWKADGSHQRYGFVAQELYEVAPEAVCKPQDPDEMMAVDYSKLVPMLVKELQSLRARVAQLEGI